MTLPSDTQAKINEFLERIRRNQVKTTETPDGLEFEERGETYELLRKSGVSGSRSSFN